MISSYLRDNCEAADRRALSRRTAGVTNTLISRGTGLTGREKECVCVCVSGREGPLFRIHTCPLSDENMHKRWWMMAEQTHTLTTAARQWSLKICPQRADGGKGDMHSSVSAQHASPCKSLKDDVSSASQLFYMQTDFLCKFVSTASDTPSRRVAQVYWGKETTINKQIHTKSFLF